MRIRHAVERARREAIRAQRAAASAHAWMRSRCDWPGAPRRDLLDDQHYVAHLYARARAAVADIACQEHRA